MYYNVFFISHDNKAMIEIGKYLEAELCDEGNRFLVPFVRSYIHKCDTHEIVKSGRVTINYVYPASDKYKIPPLLFIRKLAKRIDTLLSMPRWQFKREKLVYYILPALEPRQFPTDKEIIEPRHINAAYTYVNDDVIFIYRRDELGKTAIHEACHHLLVHTHEWRSEKDLYKAFNISMTDGHTDIRPNEAVVEFWAEMIQCCFIASDFGIPIEDLVECEIRHGLLKTKKILSFQSRVMPNGKWKEHTHAFSYIVLRTVLLYFYKEFMEIPMPYNDRIITEFMIEKFNSATFQDALKRTKLTKSKDLRMSVFGDF